ncbi:2-hydroxyacid dehydrogenase [Arthrobacter sp. zg-Y820]|uniref:2-hydroxyacid dehydrogenase n=1 Tax=unclassified Arthrobacter TaxID=235627 RepID=UPI001E2C265C|nr:MULTISPECIES: 2-hydroxyacid dehydrogenase [unclassified Arthrobacter]MCC9196162.1 2-hydroxyacid dehydrogenase [Arthrobacter sp. zg-Y820]MDK1279022.1 2-hydroxyacid dehydrogenase [Arthrobacter sp. zg.Y820]WIB08568.1 2-hydroxyacid dehydrogenase [Arthrobacter sp. zg-Y820]
MNQQFRPIRSITLPTEELLQAMSPLPDGIRAGLWDVVGEPKGLEYGEIDAVVLPYATGSDWQEALDRVPNLKMLQAQSTGYDGLPELVGPDVAVVSAAGVHVAGTAELALTLMLASLRGVDAAVRNSVTGTWDSRRFPGLADRRVLLVGVGGIGAAIAERLEPFEVELTRVGSRARTDERGTIHGTDELVELAKTAEVVVVITPLTEQTRHLINKEVLAALPDGALVVNVARGPVVDTEALTAEVLSGRLHAALDVVDPEPLPADHPLWKAPNAIITPHVGGNTEAFVPRIRKLLKEQIGRLARGEEPVNLVRRGPWA